MSALQADRTNIIEYSPEQGMDDSGPRGTPTFYVRGLVMKGADGVCNEASGSSGPNTAVCVGISRERTNSVIANPSTITYRKGFFSFANGTSADALTDGEAGKLCWAGDDQTACATDGVATRPILGRLLRVDAVHGPIVHVDGLIPSGTTK